MRNSHATDRRFEKVPFMVDPHYADVAVPRRGGPVIRLLKSLIRRPRDRPNYENALVDGLGRCVRPNDRIVIIGGGLGVTAIIAARLAAPYGNVICFEGGRDQVARIKRNAIFNKVNDRLNVYHAFVGPHDHVYSDISEATNIPIAELPDCDVLELDCEGAEIEILSSMTIRPRAILVESHGFYGAPSHTVSSLLNEMGYNVENLGVAEIDVEGFCIENDIFVLMATRTQAVQAENARL